MFRSILITTAAALLAGLTAFALSGVPAAKSETATALPETGTACSQHAWPNYEPRCMFDATRPAGETRTIRIISLDRGDLRSRAAISNPRTPQ
jgi:hypothetical protein